MKQTSLNSFFKCSAPTTPSTQNRVTPSRNPGSSSRTPNRTPLRNDSNSNAKSKTKTPAPKRKRQDSDSDDEFFTPNTSKLASKKRRAAISSDEEDDELGMDVEKSTPNSSKNVSSSLSTIIRPSSTNLQEPKNLTSAFDRCIGKGKEINLDDLPNAPKLSKMQEEKLMESTSCITTGNKEFPAIHFLLKENIKDSEGRRPDHPNYDSKTLFVPAAYYDKVTPGHKQWWDFKRTHFDTILFHKVGRFYELYHMDAEIGHDLMGLNYMKGDYAHVGFPEKSYGLYAEQLLKFGHSVARIEQTETPEGLEQRKIEFKKANQKVPQVVNREICRVTNRASRTCAAIDAENDLCVDSNDGENENFLMAITTIQKENNATTFGICFINTCVGKFYLTQFEDNATFSGLRTLVSHFQPAQLLLEKNCVSKHVIALLTSLLPYTKFEYLISKAEFMEAHTTIYNLCDEKYLGSFVDEWPEEIKSMVQVTSGPIPKTKERYVCAMKSFGALLYYLGRCLIDVDMVSMKHFELLLPADMNSERISEEIAGRNRWNNRKLILDGDVIFQLNLLPPMIPSGKYDPTLVITSKASFHNVLNHCTTVFGKRLFRKWICAPTCDSRELTQRQKAILILRDNNSNECMGQIVEVLKQIPDLEKLLQKNHTSSLNYRVDQHPDGRAMFFDAKIYNKRRIKDFIRLVNGFKKIVQIVDIIKNSSLMIENSALKDMFGQPFDFSEEDVEAFTSSFDSEQAQEDGLIITIKGYDSEFDECVERYDRCNQDLDNYLSNLKRKLRCEKIKYCDAGKLTKAIEIPNGIEPPDDFEQVGKTKNSVRYTCNQNEMLVNNLKDATNQQEEARGALTRKIYALFDSMIGQLTSGLMKIARLDCLISLTYYSLTSGLEMTMPEFDFETDDVYLRIEQGYHPSLALNLVNTIKTNLSATSDYMSNDTVLDDSKGRVMLMTGPNMGGKSTLMRQTATLIILAHLGSMVPAQKMELTPVDRIFTRIGANDKIFSGESTFAVELNETNMILTNATKNSFVLMDELGRGTGTVDGYAIAGAALKYLAEKIQCRSIFSTHFQNLCAKFVNHPKIYLGHMSCVVENETDEPTNDDVTFLYKLADGICPKSYGFYVAKIAGVPDEIVKRANKAAERFAEFKL
uniref:DNA mismatch repair protein n=1 Tax=Rhabditophanes sp. KR3021 TaxID=114890 RepID=A0AC35TLD1_9BILA